MGGEAGRALSGGLRSCACSRTGLGRHHHHHHVITVTPDFDPPKVTGPITTAELLAALSTSKLSSSSGPDGIPAIALRIEEFEDDILKTGAGPTFQWAGKS